MKKDLLSVIVPVYNVEQYLEECIEDLINQTYKNIEIILVDDGSTDDSGNICDKYKEIDDRIIVIHKTNGGPTLARKTGLRIAKGKYICFVDSDDFFSEYMFENMIETIQDTDLDFVHFNYNNDNKLNRGVRNNKVYRNANKYILIENVFNRGEDGNKIIQSFFSNIYRRDFIKKYLKKVPDECRYGEDLLCMCYMLLSGCNFAVDNRAFYHYRSRQGSICHTSSFEVIKKINNMYQYLSEANAEYGRDSDLEKEIEDYYLNVIKEYLYDNHEEFLYPIDNVEDLRNKKIIIYGAGKCGKDYYRQLRLFSDIEIVAWIDKRVTEIENNYYQLSHPEKIREIDYDKIVIGVLDKYVSDQIIKDLVAMGVDRQKIMI